MGLLAEFELFPRRASTVAGDVDALTIALVLISGFFTVLIAVLLFYFAIKYRRRSESQVPRPIVGSLRLEIIWSAVPLVIGLIIFFWSSRVYFAMYRAPEDAMEVKVVGKQWMWKVQHPGGQSETNALHVPVGQPVKLTMISEDVIHSFFIPDFRIKQDVLPGRYTTIWFTANRVGTYDLYCTEYCGTDHSRMIGKVVVMEQAEYQGWLEGWHRERPDGSAAAEGEKLFRKLNCISCHSADARARAPLLEELYGKMVPLDNGRLVKADEDYLRRSILNVNPREEVVAGFKPMPTTYKGQVTEEEILQLIAFIRSLKRGGTPSRVEDTRPPPPLKDDK